MELSGWMTAGIMVIMASAALLGRGLDRLPAVSKKMITAIRAVRAVRDELRSGRK